MNTNETVNTICNNVAIQGISVRTHVSTRAIYRKYLQLVEGKKALDNS